MFKGAIHPGGDILWSWRAFYHQLYGRLELIMLPIMLWAVAKNSAYAQSCAHKINDYVPAPTVLLEYIKISDCCIRVSQPFRKVC